VTPRLIYVAGKYRAETPWQIEKNIHEARRWGVLLVHAGAYPVIPHSNTAQMDNEGPDDLFLKGTMELLRRCDGALFIPRWPSSLGAVAEWEEAHRLGIPVLDGARWSDDPVTVGELSAWISNIPPRT